MAAPAPGLTHVQHAQPVSFGHWLLAHVQPLLRDLERLRDWDVRTAISPLGSGGMPPSPGYAYPNWAYNALGGLPAAVDPGMFVAARTMALTFVDLATQPAVLEAALRCLLP